MHTFSNIFKAYRPILQFTSVKWLFVQLQRYIVAKKEEKRLVHILYVFLCFISFCFHFFHHQYIIWYDHSRRVKETNVRKDNNNNVF